MLDAKFNLAQLCNKFPLIVFYQGNYQETPSHSILNIVEKNISSNMKKPAVRSILYLMIEALQNIERYSAHTHSSDDYSLVYSDNKFFHIYTQNVIENVKIEGLKKRLDSVIDKSKEELDEIYSKTLSGDERTEKGAGLGLIDLARKTRNRFFYEFNTLDEKYSTYSICFAIPLNREDYESQPNFNESKEIIKKLNHNFKNNLSTLFYGGDFSNNFVRALLDLITTVKKENIINHSTKIHHVLIELTQNIRRHAYKTDDHVSGQLCIEWQKQNLCISTYNIIEHDKIEGLTKKIDSLNACDFNGLEEMSKKSLTDFTEESGVGLIDVSLFAFPNKIQYLLKNDLSIGTELLLKINLSHD
ncbi:MAG: SiaB family protein kinase [Bacteroidota bacterium]